MMNKRFAIYGLLATTLALYVGYLGLCFLDDGVSEKNFQELKVGMTKWEVRSKLGYTHSYSGVVLVKGMVHVTLVGDDGAVMLAFNEEDRLIWKDWDERHNRSSQLPLAERLGVWLGLIIIRE